MTRTGASEAETGGYDAGSPAYIQVFNVYGMLVVI